mmetsp:Transcript_3749/g.12610  ORF Transcript_3749/g.12610 Transcript_3749/m.12610 type:complete len:312 (-) Transcript_3749:2736-3671(-)
MHRRVARRTPRALGHSPPRRRGRREPRRRLRGANRGAVVVGAVLAVGTVGVFRAVGALGAVGAATREQLLQEFGRLVDGPLGASHTDDAVVLGDGDGGARVGLELADGRTTSPNDERHLLGLDGQLARAAVLDKQRVQRGDRGCDGSLASVDADVPGVPVDVKAGARLLLQPLDICAGAANDDGDGRERDLAPLLTHVERRRKSLLHALDGSGQTEERERPADAVEVKHRVVRLLQLAVERLRASCAARRPQQALHLHHAQILAMRAAACLLEEGRDLTLRGGDRLPRAAQHDEPLGAAHVDADARLAPPL